MRILATITGFLVGGVTFWMMWPAPFEPSYWEEPEPPAMQGAYAVNDDLSYAETVQLGPRGDGAAEGIAFGADGRVYFSTHIGRLGRVTPAESMDGWIIEDLAQIAEVPIMGLAWIDDRTLGIAANSGLLALDTESLELRSLSTGSPSRPFGFVNDLDVADDGTIFFTDSSTRWGHQSDSPGYFYDMMENRPHGILYAWDPRTRSTRVVRDRLFYPAGVLIEPGGQSVLVAESFRYTIQRVWVAGPRQGEIEVFADNLPGMPDGLEYGSGGTLYVAMLRQRSELLRALRQAPFWNKMLVKLPIWLRPDGGTPTGFILELDASTGEALRSHHDPIGRLSYISTLAPTPSGDLWFGSTYGAYLGRFSTATAVPPSAGRDLIANE